MDISISVMAEREPFTENYDDNQMWKNGIRNSLSNNQFLEQIKQTVKSIEFYHINDSRVRNNNTDQSRLLVLNKANERGTNDSIRRNIHFHPRIGTISASLSGNYSDNNGRKIIEDNAGNTIAVFYEDTMTLYTRVNIVELGFENGISLFEFILRRVANYISGLERNRDWTSEDKREGIVESLKHSVIRNVDAEARHLKSNIENTEQDIRSRIEDLNQRYMRVQALSRELELIQGDGTELMEKLIKEFDNITSLDIVDKLLIDGNRFTVRTKDIYAYDSRDQDRYYIGKFNINIQLFSTAIKFENINNPRRSYWSGRDHHPHVSGEGNACFGNVASTVAQLVSQNELYALTLTLIDFLENANMEDQGGRYVTNWDRVDEEGNVIPHREEEVISCDNCEREYPQSYTMTHAYAGITDNYDIDELEDGDLIDGEYVCDSCIEEQYEYINHLDEFVHNHNFQ